MFKLLVPLSLFCLIFGCGDGNGIHTSAYGDSGVDSSDDVSDIPDSGIEAETDDVVIPPEYNPCVSSFNVPFTKGGGKDAKRCLLQTFCIDSNDKTLTDGYYDQCHGFSCNFGVACSNDLVYCLPLNNQTPEYSAGCKTMVAAEAIVSRIAVSKYVGIDATDKNGLSCISTYTIGMELPCSANGLACELSYRERLPGATHWSCNSETLNFPNVGWFYLNEPAVDDSKEFVSQW